MHEELKPLGKSSLEAKVERLEKTNDSLYRNIEECNMKIDALSKHLKVFLDRKSRFTGFEVKDFSDLMEDGCCTTGSDRY